MIKRRFKDVHPELVHRFDVERNAALGIDINSVGVHSSLKAYWLCEVSHSTYKKIDHYGANGGYCRECHSVGYLRPDLVEMCHPDDRDILSSLLPKSNKTIRWICNRNHVFNARVAHVSSGSGCRYCAGQDVWPGENDLGTLYPEYARRISDKSPHKAESLRPGSDKIVVWVCDTCTNEYSRSVDREIKAKGSCPYCTNQEVLEGFNDLATTHPKIAAQIHHSSSIRPEETTFGMKAAFPWVCGRGHIWSAPIYRRTGGTDCPKCSLFRTSKIEQEIYTRIRKIHPTAANSVRLRLPYLGREWMIADIKVGSVIVEYDGSYWHHKTLDLDTAKTNALLDAGYRVVRIREQSRDYSLPSLDIEHPNLLQISYQYSQTYDMIDECLGEINKWVNTSL